MNTIKESSRVALEVEGRLKNITYQMVQLYERWSEDYQVRCEQQIMFGDQLEMLALEIEKLQKVLPQVWQHIEERIQAAVAGVEEEMSTVLHKAIQKTLANSERELGITLQRVSQEIKFYEESAWARKWRGGIGIVFMIAVMGLGLAWYEVSQSVNGLTPQQKLIYQEGRMLHAIWPKLSRKEKRRVLMLATETDEQGSFINFGGEELLE